ncbi:hypothetical protein BREVNS_1355 [Brevinematales bacterium NS]|nr:hypothetical protein BREVNS_1355 [Brevinematales bacterium NS]
MVIFTQKLNTCSTIFSLSVLGYFFYPFSFFYEALPRGAKGAPPLLKTPFSPLQRFLGTLFFLLSCRLEEKYDPLHFL